MREVWCERQKISKMCCKNQRHSSAFLYKTTVNSICMCMNLFEIIYHHWRTLYENHLYSNTWLLSNIVINRDFNEYIGMGSAPQLEDDSDTLMCKWIVCSTFSCYKIEFDGLKWTGFWCFLQGVLSTNEKPEKCMLKCSGRLFEVVAM